MTMQRHGLARSRESKRPRPGKPYIQATSPEFLRILPDARRQLEDAQLGQDGRPKNKGGRPKKVRP